MPQNDMLLHVASYPNPTSREAIEQAVRFAAASDSALAALIAEIDLKNPGNWLSDQLIDLGALCADEEAKSRSACEIATATLAEARAKHGVVGETLVLRVDPYDVAPTVARHARTRDLCLIPIMDAGDGQRSVTEAAIFNSGRPVVLFRPGVGDLPGEDFGTVVVAWDGTRSAARALADAIPLLRKARAVRVLTVLNDKPQAKGGLGAEVVRHLALHDVAAVADEVQAGKRKIGQVISEFALEHRASLVVMGAYGHSRLKEFVLGGATEHMLRNLQVALLLAH